MAESLPPEPALCDFEDCGRRAVRPGRGREGPSERLCWGHLKQRRRGRPLAPLRAWQKPMEALEEAGVLMLDAETPEEFERARERFRGVLRRMLAKGNERL